MVWYHFFFVEYVLKKDDEKPEDETISNILLWAIFSNRKELAEICWLRVENHLCMCYKIFKGRFAQYTELKSPVFTQCNVFTI